MSEFSIQEEISKLAREYHKTISAIEQRRARAVVLRWLRPRLRWLADHPRVLKWYLRLPHKTTVVAIYEANSFGPAEFKIMRKADLP